MARVELIDLHDSDDPAVREFAPKVSRPDGSIGGHFAAEAHFPAVMRNVYEARLALAREGDLGNRLFVKLAVAISMATGCTYCTGAFSTQLGRQLGDEEAVRAFHRQVQTGDLEGPAAALLPFALTLLEDPAALSDADFDRLRDDHGFTDRTFVELVYVVNIISGYNRLTIAFDLEYDHDFPEAWAREAATASIRTTPAGD